MCRQAVKPKSMVKVIDAAREGQKLHSDFESVRSGQVGDMSVAVWEDEMEGKRAREKVIV